MIVSLVDAVRPTCGGKAATLGALLRAGFPVPDGFVLPFAAYRAAVRTPGLAVPLEALAHGLDRLGSPPVAVRSSATTEDTAARSAAGQHQTLLAVQGVDAVADAVRTCWASLHSPGAVAYRDGSGHPPTSDAAMGVLVQRHVDAEVSGVMFTPPARGGATEVEASWGLGPSVVGGTVTPDAYRVTRDGTVARTVADKPTRLDRDGVRVVTRDVPVRDRRRPTLDDATVVRLAGLGDQIAELLGGAQDVEWSIAGGEIWVLQARPVTADLPPHRHPPTPAPSGIAGVTLTGTPGSRGTATGTARVVRGPGDFARVQPGDILVCPTTDPGWTPLLRIAGGVVTEVGGVLSHAAIVAREYTIPAVLGIADATTRLHDGARVTLDGAAGTVTTTSG